MKNLIITLLITLFFNTSSYAIANVEHEINKTTTQHNIITHIKKQIFKLNMLVNKKMPKYMKKLKDNPSITNILLLCFIGFIYGIIHTLGPGHGKMVVATYLLSSDNPKIINGVMIGLKMALFHVGGAIVLVLASKLLVFNFITNQHESLYYLKLISYGLIFGLGCYMLYESINKLKHKNCSGCKVCNKTKDDNLTAFAIGFVPCTGSLLILLYSLANNILHLGILVVIFVAIGMALTMIMLGLICIFSKKHFINKLEHNTLVFKYLEILGSIIIILIGSILFYCNII